MKIPASYVGGRDEEALRSCPVSTKVMPSHRLDAGIQELDAGLSEVDAVWILVWEHAVL
jgi:hypothetical protein